MDKTTEQLVTYAESFSESNLTQPISDAALKHIVDTVICMVIGSTSPAAKIATSVAAKASSPNGATVVGTEVRTLPDIAAFANLTMVRSWDWQDGMFAKAGGHPCFMVPAILAVGELILATPQEVLLSTVLAYEFLGALGSTIPGGKRWSATTFIAPSTALALGKLLKLTPEQMANAVQFSICPGVGNNMGIRHAVYAALLAREGMTGTIDRSSGFKEPFDGEHGGLWMRLQAEDVRTELQLPAMPNGPMVVEMSYMKQFPAELHSQALLGLVPRIREWTTPDEISSIEIEGYQHMVHALGSQPDILDPKDVRQAGFSLPYMLSVALVDGGLTPKQFTPERFSDPSLRPLMSKFKIRENPEFTENYRPPGMEIIGNPCALVRIRKNNGDEFVEEVTFPKGHSLNPMSVADLNLKMDAAFDGLVAEATKEEIRSAWWSFEEAEDVSWLMRTLARQF